MVNVAIIGTGHVARIHMIAFRIIKDLNLLDLEIGGVADINPKELHKFQKDHQLENGTTNYQDLLKNDKIDVIYICTPTNTHREIFFDAVDSGKVIFMEKPLAVNLSEAQDMINKGKSGSQLIQVGFVLRFHPLIEYTKRIISQNQDKFGKLISIILRNDEYFPIQGIHLDSKWRVDKEVAGGGVLLEHAIHDVDLFYYLFGEFQNYRGNVNQISEYPVEDYVSAHFNFENGGTGNLIALWHNILRRSNRRIEIFLENAFIEFSLDRTEYFRILELNERLKEIPLREIHDKYREWYEIPQCLPQIMYFYEDLAFLRRFEKDDLPLPYPSLDDALRAHKVIDQIYKSSNIY